MKPTLDNWKLWLVVSLTLGLAPFVPEPHIVGKLRWLMGGAIGMKPIDWFDLVQHGFPFVLLFRALFIKFSFKNLQLFNHTRLLQEVYSLFIKFITKKKWKNHLLS